LWPPPAGEALCMVRISTNPAIAFNRGVGL
jgi:hypothetical protein